MIIAHQHYRRVALLGWLIVTTTGGSISAQENNPREIPWRDDVAGGRLTNPGRSQLLPPTRENSAVGQQLPVVDSDQPSSDDASYWWEEDAEQTVVSPEMPSRGRSSRGEIIQSTQILAWVGSEAILAGDLLGRINELLQPAVGKATEAQLDEQRWILMERMLPSAVESKLVFLDFVRRMEQEQVDAVRTSVYEQFDEKQLPRLVEQAKLKSPAEFERRLRAFGTSTEYMRRSFFEQVAAREMIRQHESDDDEVTHDELLIYYKQHADEFAFPAKCRWEHLMVQFAAYDSKQQAYRAIAKMGNAVLRGAKLSVVARRDSEGPTAEDGGVHDWTTKGSLVSIALDEAIFSIRPGEMSDIIEDENGFHIVRVMERNDAGYVSFLEAQVQIRKQIEEERKNQKVKDYVERLKRETYVWNYFEDTTRLARKKERTP